MTLLIQDRHWRKSDHYQEFEHEYYNLLPDLGITLNNFLWKQADYWTICCIELHVIELPGDYDASIDLKSVKAIN